MALPPGTRLGPYEIQDPLGAGGMGEVYRARDTRLERIVAIKVLPTSLAESPERRMRFEREARAISALNHPHICMLYDVGHQDGIDYLVMEYVERILSTAQFHIGDKDLVRRALDDYRHGKGDFADYLIGHSGRDAGCEATATFDRRLKDGPAFRLLR